MLPPQRVVACHYSGEGRHLHDLQLIPHWGWSQKKNAHSVFRTTDISIPLPTIQNTVCLMKQERQYVTF